MKANVEKLVPRRWNRAWASAGWLLRLPRWLGLRDPLRSFQESNSVTGSARQLSLVRTDPLAQPPTSYNRGARLPLLLFMVQFSIHLLAIDAFEVQGTLRMRTLAGESKLADLPVLAYSAKVEGCKWWLSTVDLTSSLKATVAISYDGQTRIHWNGKANAATPSVAIESNEVPIFMPYPHLPIVWMAAASGCYMKAGPLEMVAPYSQDVARRPLRIKYDIEPGVIAPSSWVFLNRDGSTNGVFTVRSYLDFGGRKIPEDYDLVVFETHSSNSPPTIVLECSGKSKVSQLTTPISYRPKMSEKTVNSDMRFVSMGSKQVLPFIYQTNRILTAEEARTLPAFEKYASIESATTNLSWNSGGPLRTEFHQNGRSLLWLFIIFGGGAIGFAIWKTTTK